VELQYGGAPLHRQLGAFHYSSSYLRSTYYSNRPCDALHSTHSFVSVSERADGRTRAGAFV